MISVVMATYNGEKYIIEQLESIMRQTVPVDEVIICDDMSKDNTVELIKEFVEENNLQSIVKLYVNTSNMGYIKNFYKGIKRTKGQLIFLSDQDDIWENNKVDRMLAVMNQYKAEVLCSNFSIIDANGVAYTKSVRLPNFICGALEGLSQIKFLPLLFGNVAQGCTYCFTEKVKKIYLKANYGEIIHDYQIMLIGSALEKAFFLNEKLIRYRLHGNNNIGFSEEKSLKHVDFRIRIKKPKVAGFLDLIKNDINIPHYYIAQVILYFKIPVIKAIINRFFGRGCS